LQQHIAGQAGVGDDLPCADLALLVSLKKSPEYRTIRHRVANPKAIDAWQEDGFHFFVFQLRAADCAGASPAEAPVAVFAMHPEASAPISAVVVTPNPNGETAEIMNLRAPEGVDTTLGDRPATHNGTVQGQGVDGLKAGAPGDGPPVVSPQPRLGLSPDSPAPSPGDSAPGRHERSPHVSDAGDPAGTEQVVISGLASINSAPSAESAAAGSREQSPAGPQAQVAVSIDTIPSETENSPSKQPAVAGAATSRQQVFSPPGAREDLPRADAALLVPLRKSAEYQAIRHRVASLLTIDSWEEDGQHLFVFQLVAADGARPPPPGAPVAVFVMHPQSATLISAVVVTPGPSGEETEIMDLRHAEHSFTMPLPQGQARLPATEYGSGSNG
jgi:hypothetical protein